MNSRTRMLAAIERRPVDHIPTDIWATPEVWTKLCEYFADGGDVSPAEVKEKLHIGGCSRPARG